MFFSKIFILNCCIISLFFLKPSLQSSASIRKKVCKLYEDSSGAKPNEYTKLDYYDNDDIKDAQDFIKDQVDGKTYLRDWAIEGKINDDEFQKEFLKDISPWLIFSILSLIGIVVYICCFFFDLCCPNCVCCKKKTSYSNFEKFWPVIGLVMFCIYCIFSGSFGAYKSTNFDQGYYLLKCQIISFLDDFNAGNRLDKNALWIGLFDLKDELEGIKNEMLTVAEETFENSPWIEDGYNDINTQGGQLWSPNNVDKYTYQNYPSYLGSAAPEEADSIFYQSAWKLYTDAFNDIIGEAILALKNAMVETNGNGMSIVDEGFSSAIDGGITSVTDLIDTVNQAVSDVEDSTKDIDDTYLPSIRDYVQIYFYISIAAAVLGILAAILVVPLKLRKCRFCMHISWCVFSILMLAGFIISTILYGITILGFQGCDIMDRVLVNQRELEKLELFEGDMLDYITICKQEYGGDGEILQKFGIQSQLDEIKQLNKNLNDSLEENTAQKDELDRLTDQLQSALDNVDEMLKNGQYFVPNTDDSQQNSESYPEYVYGTLFVDGFCNGKIIDQQPANPACEDGWPSGILPGSNTDPNQCYYLHNFGKDSNENKSYCDDSETDSTAQSQLDEILLWVKSKNELISITKTKLSNYDSAVSSYITQTNDWFVKLKNFETEAGEILVKISDILGVETNCLFLGRNIDKIFQSLCVQLIPDLFWLAVNLIVHCFGMYIGAFCLYITGFRYNQFDRQKNYEEKEKENNYERTDAPEYGDKKEQAKNQD